MTWRGLGAALAVELGFALAATMAVLTPLALGEFLRMLLRI